MSPWKVQCSSKGALPPESKIKNVTQHTKTQSQRTNYSPATRLVQPIFPTFCAPCYTVVLTDDLCSVTTLPSLDLVRVAKATLDSQLCNLTSRRRSSQRIKHGHFHTEAVARLGHHTAELATSQHSHCSSVHFASVQCCATMVLGLQCTHHL